MAFRSGVYNCEPTAESADKFKVNFTVSILPQPHSDGDFQQDSPTFQLQVTFAALQESTQSVFNPTKLVESLQLRTTEQQDAQEFAGPALRLNACLTAFPYYRFSKLFMSHLDAEFKKQSNPALQSLITDQVSIKETLSISF